MSPRYKIALNEVDYILSSLEDSEVNKIPKSFMDFIDNNKTVSTVDLSNLKEETSAILAIIYRKFLAPEEDRKRLEEEYIEKLRQERKDNLPKQEINMNFEKKLVEGENEIIKKNELVKIKNVSLWSRILGTMRKILHKNK